MSQCPAQLRTAPKNSGDFSSSIFRGALPCLTRDSPSHSPGSSSLPKSSPNKSSSFFKNSGGYDLLLFFKATYVSCPGFPGGAAKLLSHFSPV